MDAAGSGGEAASTSGGQSSGGSSGADSSGGDSNGGLSGTGASAAVAGTAIGGAHGGGVPGTSVVCSGAFGVPELLFETGTSRVSSLTVAADERELYYAAVTPNDTYAVMVRTRSSTADPWESPSEVSELGLICAPHQPSIDLSDDGLRMYIECDYGPGPLYIASRDHRTAPFELKDGSIGTVGDSIDVSADELTLLASVNAESDGHVRMYQRETLDAAFSLEMFVPGIHGEFRSPTLGANGLELFGTVGSGPYRSRLAMAWRASVAEAFSAPIELALFTSDTMAEYSPILSADCRSLYFIGRSSLPAETWAVFVARR